MKTPALFALAGKTALVTGGGRGIGRHIALGLAEAGADVFIASRKLDKLEDAAAEITATGARGVAVQADITKEKEVDSLVDRVLADAGRIDILVNNSGMVWAAPTLEYPLEGWDRVFALNVRALWMLSQRVARHMKDAGGGVIIHVTSVSAYKGSREEIQPVVAYNASKGAVVTLTKDMAVKLAPHGIRVNALAPGSFLTDMMNYVRHDEEALRRFSRVIPLGRPGGPDDIKGVAVFLASDAAAYMTGHTLVVDGGVLAVDPWPVPEVD
ncbi:MAG: glucose 1-dehydrogenase [Myxococcales bacterium]|jgi:NAD(P)-dependent dehydrogenase (short-subunit alcohol dehydrogenase family)|nr:MAG: glucose 1-dehydrogenase [Myxococcales bacterium]